MNTRNGRLLRMPAVDIKNRIGTVCDGNTQNWNYAPPLGIAESPDTRPHAETENRLVDKY